MEQCQNGHPMAPGAAFCEVCGVPRPVSSPVMPALCGNGHPLAQGSAFCGTCGAAPAQSFASPVAQQPAADYQVSSPPSTYGYSYAPAPGRANNGMAIASMVLGIVWIYWVGSVLAVIFGFVALNQIGKRNESGHGMAIAGIVLGFVGIAVLVIIVIIAAAVANNANNFNGGAIFPTLAGSL